jgi:hypothetical protein
MPRGDGTGPLGMGPMMGRRAGHCAGYDVPGYANPAWGRGFCRSDMSMAGGRGFGWRNQFYATDLPFWARMNPQAWGPQTGAVPAYSAPMNREAEIEMLKAEAANIENVLKGINERLAKLSEEK